MSAFQRVGNKAGDLAQSRNCLTAIGIIALAAKVTSRAPVSYHARNERMAGATGRHVSRSFRELLRSLPLCVTFVSINEDDKVPPFEVFVTPPRAGVLWGRVPIA